MSVAVGDRAPATCSGAAYSGVKARPPSRRELGRILPGIVADQLGDAEVEQLDRAVGTARGCSKA